MQQSWQGGVLPPRPSQITFECWLFQIATSLRRSLCNKKRMSCYCYIVQCSDGTFYTGWTTDPERRVKTHNSGRGAHYTRTRRPVKLVYVESHPDRASAMKRERAIKTMKREQKQKLIGGS